MSLAAFQIQGATVLVAASSSTGLPPTQVSANFVTGALLVNPSTVPIYVAFGSSSIAASVPTTSLPGFGACIRAGADRAFNIGPSPINSQWCSAVTSAGAASPGLLVTPGFSQ